MSYSVEKLLEAQKLARAGIIFAPASFLLSTAQELINTCNGCGAADSWFRPPETIYGTWIGAACVVHDWMYNFGHSNEDKDEADRTFKHNMLRLIQRDAHLWYKPTFLQRHRALKYYLAVVEFGGPAFWAGKN